MKIIVTAGKDSADIDAVACVIAYSELLNLEDKTSIPVIAGQFTASVTPTTLKWATNYENSYTPDGSERFVLVDMSDPEYSPIFVAQDRINEVYDHRHGYQSYWREKIRDCSHIEMVAACGTLIWEEFKKRSKSQDISDNSAKLLLASIVSNSLNFKTPLTTKRDRTAYAELKEITGLSEDWVNEYFLEQKRTLLGNFEKYLSADTNVYKINSENFVIGQVELWDAEKILSKKRNEIDSVMEKYKLFPWIVNILNIEKGFNYIYSKSESGKKIMEKKLGLVFENDVAKTNKLLLRKYITKILREN